MYYYVDNDGLVAVKCSHQAVGVQIRLGGYEEYQPGRPQRLHAALFLRTPTGASQWGQNFLLGDGSNAALLAEEIISLTLHSLWRVKDAAVGGGKAIMTPSEVIGIIDNFRSAGVPLPARDLGPQDPAKKVFLLHFHARGKWILSGDTTSPEWKARREGFPYGEWEPLIAAEANTQRSKKFSGWVPEGIWPIPKI